MTDAHLLVQIDGVTMPLAGCFWVRFGPNDCAYSSVWGDEAVDADQAHQRWVPRQRDRQRDIRRGYYIELLTREQWDAKAKPCFLGTCSHESLS